MAAAHIPNSNPKTTPTLYLALELGWTEWKLAFTSGTAQKPRLRTITARALPELQREIARAKERFGLPADTPVSSCYEAGRDGFWIDRFLGAHGVQNIVVDAASIEVNRRKRRTKTDHLDAVSLAMMLIRWHQGERKLWSVVEVPSPEAEDRRQLHRELITLKDERTAHINRIKGLLASVGLSVAVDARLGSRLDGLRQWDGTALPPEVRQRLAREWERFQLIEQQIRSLEAEQRQRIRDDTTPGVELVRVLVGLRGIGPQGAWLLVHEMFGWRTVRNRRQLASLAGLAPTPYA